MFNTIISAQQLQQQLEHYCIFDCRFNLADTGYGCRVYEQGHIAGAQYLDLDQDLSSPITAESGRHPLPDPDALLNHLRACGVTPSTQVVVYDDAGGAMAARAWWLLRWLGHTAVAVLDGGFPAWQTAGFSIASVADSYSSTSSDTATETARPDTDQVVDSSAVLSNIADKKFTLVDARASARFKGEVEPIDPVAGHIPGALNRPLTDNLQQGLFKSARDLHREWQSVIDGIDPENIVHMCGSGVTACHNQLAMEIAGLHGSRIYPGSWSEWIRDPQRPFRNESDKRDK
jgi:thiosulfate/3-mercaptopyruvate sulfurtransferase